MIDEVDANRAILNGLPARAADKWIPGSQTNPTLTVGRTPSAWEREVTKQAGTR